MEHLLLKGLRSIEAKPFGKQVERIYNKKHANRENRFGKSPVKALGICLMAWK
jgi:hypothetical protein